MDFRSAIISEDMCKNSGFGIRSRTKLCLWLDRMRETIQRSKSTIEEAHKEIVLPSALVLGLRFYLRGEAKGLAEKDSLKIHHIRNRERNWTSAKATIF